MNKITKPGIYRDFDVTEYHKDPCPEPSMSQSIAKVLIDQSPLHAACAHPRLTTIVLGDAEEIEKYVKAKAIGDAAHALMIGRGKTLAVGAYDSWRTKEAQVFRDKAIKEGTTPILDDHFKQACEIVHTANLQLERHEATHCFKHGWGEVALIWQEGPFWFRCLVDWLHSDLGTADDYKTSGMSVAPHVLGQLAANANWDIQAAMIERGLNALDGDKPKRRVIRFIAQEQDPPYALNVMVMDEPWMIMGRKKLQRAIEMWVASMTSGEWPGYPPYALRPEYPGWKESQWLKREIHEAADERNPMLTSIAGG